MIPNSFSVNVYTPGKRQSIGTCLGMGARGQTTHKSHDISSSLKKHLATHYQFHRLILKDGVLHCLYIHNDVEYHQVVLPQSYHKKVLQSQHNDLGHQGIVRTLDLLRESVYWPTMTQDASLWVDQCR